MPKLVDISGNRYGRLVVINRAQDYISPSGTKRVQWNCKCDCGSIVTISARHLRSGASKSCGCLRSETTSSRSLKDLTGKRFGRLSVIKRTSDYIKDNGSTLVRWECLCDCGSIVNVISGDLLSGSTKSCGCLRKEVASFVNTTHGKSNMNLYKRWIGMKNRCFNENDPAYKHYGKRGISVCDEWVNDFESFERWSLENGYDDILSLDRIDCNGNYEPSNCRWADKVTQENNKRSNRIVSYHGKNITLGELSRITGADYKLLWQRIVRDNKSVEEALTI